MSTFLRSGRLEAFSDGVLAIIITIMVLQFKTPKGDELHHLRPLIPIFVGYLLSFVNVGIYWNNHHHLFRAVENINGKSMWANLNLLFWLSLLPFSTSWMGENGFTQWPVFIYGVILILCGISFYILTRALLPIHEKNSTLVTAIGNGKKEIITILIYSAGLGLCFVNPTLGLITYFIVAAVWFIPDKRIEKELTEHEGETPADNNFGN